MADPLLPATRGTKRNLLLASVTAISMNAFNVSIEKIPFAGLSINFDDRLFSFLILMVLSYTLCTFSLYYYIDIKNYEATSHQKQSQIRFDQSRATFNERYSGFAVRQLQRLANPEQVRLQFETDANGNNRYERNFRMIDKTTIREFGIHERDSLYRKLFYLQNFFQWVKPITRLIYMLRLNSAHRTVQIAYFFRNYFFDGALPIILGIGAMYLILSHRDLSWVQVYLPSFKPIH